MKLLRYGRFVFSGTVAAAFATVSFADLTTIVPTGAGTGVSIKISTPLTTMPRFGFFPVRVVVENSSPRAGSWKFHFETGDSSTTIGAIDSDLEVDATAGQNREVWFYIPLADGAVRFGNNQAPATTATVGRGSGSPVTPAATSRGAVIPAAPGISSTGGAWTYSTSPTPSATGAPVGVFSFGGTNTYVTAPSASGAPAPSAAPVTGSTVLNDAAETVKKEEQAARIRLANLTKQRDNMEWASGATSTPAYAALSVQIATEQLAIDRALRTQATIATLLASPTSSVQIPISSPANATFVRGFRVAPSGSSINSSNGTAGSFVMPVSISPALGPFQVSLPAIPGVFPAPPGVTSSIQQGATTSDPTRGVDIMTITFRQMGTSAQLPSISPSYLPSGSSESFSAGTTPDTITRTIVMPYAVPQSAVFIMSALPGSSGSAQPSPYLSTVPNIPGVYPTPAGVTSSSIRQGLTTTDSTGVTTQILTFRAVGPAASLPNLSTNVLPPGSTVSVNPSPGNANTVARTVTVPVVIPKGSTLSVNQAPAAPTPAALASVALARIASGATSASSSTPPSYAVVSHAEAKLQRAALIYSSSNWTPRVDRGDRPGLSIATAVATQHVDKDEPPVPKDWLPAGFDVEDVPDPSGGLTARRFIYKETVLDPGGAGTVKSSYLSGLSSSLTAEGSARRALAGTGLLQTPSGASESVFISALSSGSAGGPVAWMTTFVQTGSGRALPLLSNSAIPPGAVVNLHPSTRAGEVVRTVTYVDPADLIALDASLPNADRGRDSAAAEARTKLQRYGYLRPQAGVQILRSYPGLPTNDGRSTNPGSVIWYEVGPEKLLPMPLFGTLPPDTSAYIKRGSSPAEVVRCFVVGDSPAAPRPSAAATTTAGATTAAPAELRISASGAGIVGTAAVSFNGLQPSSSAGIPPLAVPATMEPIIRRALNYGYVGTAPNLVIVDASALPPDWRVWSPFNGVILPSDEYAAYDPSQKNALRNWVAQGGRLFLVPKERIKPREERLGAGMIVTLPRKMEDFDSPNVTRAIQSGERNAPPAPLSTLLHLYEPSLSIPYGDALRLPGVPPDVFQERGRTGSSVSVLILVAFGLLAGPLNVIFFAPVGRRHRLLFTTPAIALTCAAVLGASIVAQDGFGGNGARAAAVVLLPDELSAVVYQDQIALTGVLASHRFSLDDETVMANIPVDEYDASGRTSVLFRNEGAATGDWFRNHWGEAQHLRRLTPSRSRIQVVSVSREGAPTVESTIPVPLRSFVYVDDKDRTWFAAEVTPGRPVTLASVNLTEWPPLHTRGSSYLEYVFSTAAKRETGRWVARAGASEIAPIPTLGSISWRDDVVYTGLVSGVVPATPAADEPDPEMDEAPEDGGDN